MSKSIIFEKVNKAYPGTTRSAVHDVDLEIMEGHLVVLLGPSGCGKTTLLKMVNRLIEPTSGRILVNDKNIAQLPINELRRGIGYVIQQVGLFPHMRVEKNVAVVPQLLGWEKERTTKRVNELLELVGLPPAEYRYRYPAQLSGGQQSRVGLARALAVDPPVMLMDEPFAALDNITRTRLQDELLRIQKTVRKTVLFVTHDIEEALRLADEIVILSEGRVIQYDTPLNILTNPANDFVAQLTGANDSLRRLSLQSVASLMLPWKTGRIPEVGPYLNIAMSLREALSVFMTTQQEELPVLNEEGHPVGKVALSAVRQSSQTPLDNKVNQG